jgi:hypothetical protein
VALALALWVVVEVLQLTVLMVFVCHLAAQAALEVQALHPQLVVLVFFMPVAVVVVDSNKAVPAALVVEVQVVEVI